MQIQLNSKEEALAKITELVNNFSERETALESGSDMATEAQIENDFIRPLFRALNWNVENVGLSGAQREFVLQRTERSGKRPDYVLRLEDHDLLFMDAKMVKYRMSDPRWLQQVYAYAYSTQNYSSKKKVDFAILSDFQEFVLLDCTMKSKKPQAVSTFKVLDWRYTDYIKEFDTLWRLFECNNMLRDSRERKSGLWSMYLSPKKVKANRIPPDKAFLAEMDDDETGWRVRLAKDVKKNNPDADGELITAVVQLLIDRLIFVKVLSDREIEEDYLSLMAEMVEQDGLAEKDFGWFVACRKLFDKLNKIYNGSVFIPRPELEAVSVSNKAVRDVIRDLEPEYSSYNFAILPVEILGAIYERFLGRVVITTAKRVKIKEKPEVKKAGGVYYTPQYIVDYIVNNTLGKFLEKCKTPSDVSKIKMLDPACGSGSFLLGAYDTLIEWHKKYYGKRKLNEKDRKAAYYDENGGIRLTAKLKREILRNNIHGVDIDHQAVEVTCLSLSLKALEDTRHDELYQEVDLFNATVLPDLSDNIKQGNSLIGNDFSLIPDERIAAHAFDWKDEFQEIMESGGFDLIIGNPPYRSLLLGKKQKSEDDRIIKYYESTLPNSSQYKLNLFGLFMENCIRLLSSNGLFSFIIPSLFYTSYHFRDLRRSMLESGRFKMIFDLRYRVFEKAEIGGNGIFIYTPNKKHKKTVISNAKSIHEFSRPKKFIADSNQFLDDKHFTLFINRELSRIISKINMIPTRELGSICTIYQGIITGDNKKYLSQKPRGKKWEKILRGRNIDRYHIEFGGVYVYYSPQDLWSNTNPKMFKVQGKLISRQTSDRLVAAYDGDGYFSLDSTHVIHLKESDISIKYLLGIYNSRLLNFIYTSRVKETGRAFAQVKVVNLKPLPIRIIDFDDVNEKKLHERMVDLVTQMLDLNEQRASAKTQHARNQFQRQIDYTDRKIDELVYELYGLTDEETRIVEEAST